MVYMVVSTMSSWSSLMQQHKTPTSFISRLAAAEQMLPSDVVAACGCVSTSRFNTTFIKTLSEAGLRTEVHFAMPAVCG